MSKLFITAVSSMIAGGLIFGSALTQADDGRSVAAFWPAASDAGASAAARQRAGSPTRAPTPPRPPTPPTAPRPAPTPRPGVTVQIEDGKVQIDGIEHMIDEQIDRALEAIDQQHIPPQVRDKMRKHLEKAREKARKRIIKIKTNDLESLGEELGRMGEELGEEMEQFGKEMEKWGEEFEKNVEKKLEKKLKKLPKHGVDWDDHDDDLPGHDIDDADDLDDAMRDLGSLKLKPNQREQLKRLRLDSEAKVAAARRELDKASETLRRQLESPGASDQEVARSIDTVTRYESEIRKARILAWVNARRLLDDAQRQQVEGAAKGRGK